MPSWTVAPIRDPLFGGTVDANVALWFHNPHNRFGCSTWSGHQFGYFHCGSQIWWYWWRPHCGSPCFYPYSYYWWPSCYYLPAYYPSYSYVRYVDEYWDDGAYYSSYAPEAEAPPADSAAAPPADAATLLAAGWEQFRAASYGDALESFRQAVLADPEDAQAKVAFAQALFAVGNYADAAFLIRRAFEKLPDWPVTGEDPRVHYADPADHAEQMVALRSFLEHVYADPAATLVLAVQNYFTGDFEAARAGFTFLASLDRDDLVAKRFLERLGEPAAPAAPVRKDEPKSDH